MNHLTPSSRGRGWLRGTSIGYRGEEERCGQEASPQENAGRDALEKRRRAQAREGLPLEGSPSKENDDDDEGMVVHLGFSPEARILSKPTSAGPFDGADVPAQGPTASLFEAQTSAKPNPIPAVVDEAGAME